MSKLKHVISVQKANELTAYYSKNKSKILKDEFHDKVLPTCETFDRAAFDQLLSGEDCVGIRIYFGMDEAHEISLIIRGVNEKNEDIYPSKDKTRSLQDSSLINEPVFALASGLRCPPYCPPPPPPDEP